MAKELTREQADHAISNRFRKSRYLQRMFAGVAISAGAIAGAYSHGGENNVEGTVLIVVADVVMASFERALAHTKAERTVNAYWAQSINRGGRTNPTTRTAFVYDADTLVNVTTYTDKEAKSPETVHWPMGFYTAFVLYGGADILTTGETAGVSGSNSEAQIIAGLAMLASGAAMHTLGVEKKVGPIEASYLRQIDNIDGGSSNLQYGDLVA